MILTEDIFFKILDYENLDLYSLLKKISEILNVQFFQDNEIYTLGNEYFIIDINKNLRITFVEESLYDKFKYIEEYLNFYLKIKNFKKFYKLLKYFIFYFSNKRTKNQVQKVQGGFCECINSYNYCDLSNLEITNKDLILNIFTHRYEKFEYELCFISIPETGNINNLNLGECLDYEWINRTYLKKFLNSFCSIQINNTKIYLDYKMNVFIDDLYDAESSFLFKYGLSLKECFLRYKQKII